MHEEAGVFIDAVDASTSPVLPAVISPYAMLRMVRALRGRFRRAPPGWSAYLLFVKGN